MARSAKKTQNIAVHIEIAERLNEISEQMKVSQLEIASQILRRAFDSGDIKVDIRTVTYEPKEPKATPKKK